MTKAAAKKAAPVKTAAKAKHEPSTIKRDADDTRVGRVVPTATKHSRMPNDAVVPSAGFETAMESTSLARQEAPTGLVNPLMQKIPATADSPEGEQNGAAEADYESRLLKDDDRHVPPLEPPMTAGLSADTVTEQNATSSHIARQKMAHKVLISKDTTAGKSVRFQNGDLFMEVPVGVETPVSEEIFQAMSSSDIPFTSTKL